MWTEPGEHEEVGEPVGGGGPDAERAEHSVQMLVRRLLGLAPAAGVGEGGEQDRVGAVDGGRRIGVITHRAERRLQTSGRERDVDRRLQRRARTGRQNGEGAGARRSTSAPAPSASSVKKRMPRVSSTGLSPGSSGSVVVVVSSVVVVVVDVPPNRSDSVVPPRSNSTFEKR